MQTTTMSLLVALCLGGPQSDGRSLSNAAVVERCQVFLIDDVDIPAQESGLLVAVHVKEGEVYQNDLIAQIDDRQAQLQKIAAALERDAARAEANNDIEVRFAIKSLELADSELKQDIDINRKSPGAVPAAEIKRKQLAKHRAELQIERSEHDLKVAQMTADVQNAAVQSADENILRRKIVAPFDGTVVDVYRQANEWVNAGEPVLRVVRMDRLRVDGFIDGHELDPSEVFDRPVTVEVELARGRLARFPGRVVIVSPLVQAGSRYRFRAEVENRQENGHWLLRPGNTATMVIHLQ